MLGEPRARNEVFPSVKASAHKRPADGPYSFPTRLSEGSNYEVVVASQPTSPAQNCSAHNGNGGLANFTLPAGKAVALQSVKSDFSGQDDYAHAVAIQPDGKIVVAGKSPNWARQTSVLLAIFPIAPWIRTSATALPLASP